ncbi:FAD-dependent monooxygenase [Mangrovicoccus ximenensis]|uniref:FAD-dependent monooxygenase n=1 Tax=Mangrovicoccus ximenensis TaxID=1911570 RepID=UPI000D3831F3|nr:FAD-dependent monooxygenase [Mangrovicoccus ximenensis]
MKQDVLIAGGSLNGASLALALARAGLRVAVIDPLSDADQTVPEFDGRSYALAAASVKMLGMLGLWDRLAPDAQPMLDIRIGDGRAGEGTSPLTLHFDSRELGEGPLGQMVEDRHLRAALLAALAETPGITRIEGAVAACAEPAGRRGTLTAAAGRCPAKALPRSRSLAWERASGHVRTPVRGGPAARGGKVAGAGCRTRISTSWWSGSAR